jgi:hypothetical protein
MRRLKVLTRFLSGETQRVLVSSRSLSFRPPEPDRGALYGRLLGAQEDLDASYSAGTSTKIPGSIRK